MSEQPAYRLRRSAVDTLAQRYKARTQPLSAMLEIADRCNEACVHCYQVQGKKGELSTEQLKRAMDELKNMGVLLLTLSGGEPTLRRDFLELVQYARECRFAVKIYTNGLNVSHELAERLGQLAVQEVQISLYSSNAKAHDGITRVPGSFEKTVSSVKSLRGAGVRVVVKTPLMDINQDQTAEYVALVQSLGADYSIDPKLSPREDGDLAPLERTIDKAAYLALRRQPGFAKRPPSVPSRPMKSSPCGACSGNLHMEANGELRPCSLWSVPTGQATEGLEQAWAHNEAAQSIRRLNWESLPSCRQCELRDLCSRCFADAFNYTGDALAAYEQACTRSLWAYELRTGVVPKVKAGPGASERLGPFQRVGEHEFLSHPALPNSQDNELQKRLPFLRNPSSAQLGKCPDPKAKGSAQLLQIRVPRTRTLTGPATEPSPTAEAPAAEG